MNPIPTSPPGPLSAESVGEYEEPWRSGPPLRYGRLRTGWNNWGKGERSSPFPQEYLPLPLHDSIGLESRQLQGEGSGEGVQSGTLSSAVS